MIFRILRRILLAPVVFVSTLIFVFYEIVKNVLPFALAILGAVLFPALWDMYITPLSFLWVLGLAAVGGFAGMYLAVIITVPIDEWLSKKPTDTHGSARFLMEKELRRAGLTGERGFILGRTHLGSRVLRSNRPGHAIVCAPTRSGKGRSSVIPNLLDHPGSAVVIDPKGENAAVTASWRQEQGNSVHVLDPWGVSGRPSSAFNPMDWLDSKSEDLPDDAAMLADMMVVSDGPEKERHWDDEAKALLIGLILHVATRRAGDERTLGEVRRLVTLPPDGFGALLKEMEESSAAFGLVARAAARTVQKADAERSGVISAAQRHTHFLDSPRIARTTRHSDFDLRDLKRSGNLTVYLSLPADRLAAYSRWLRIMVALSLTAVTKTPGRPPIPVAFFLDEFAALGRMTPVETAMGLVGGYGASLLIYVQDLAQLKATYPKWQSFLANAAVFQAFGTTDQFTAELLSRMLGTQTIQVITESEGYQSQPGQWTSAHSTGTNKSAAGRSLLMPDEIRTLPAWHQLIFLQGESPIYAQKVDYLNDPLFQGRFQDNPLEIPQQAAVASA